MKRSSVNAILLGAVTFILAIFLSRGIVEFLPNSPTWTKQVILKTILILLSIAAIKLFLKIPLADAGFRKSSQPIKKRTIIFSGMGLGGLATVLIFFTPAEGISLAKQLNLLEFLFVIVIWSSIAEEIFIRGFLQSYLKPVKQKTVDIFRVQFSLSVLICAFIFSGMHLSLLFTDADYYTVIFTMFTTFLLGLLAGVYREKYESILPPVITHMSFNIGGIITGIIIAILYKIITGELPPH